MTLGSLTQRQRKSNNVKENYLNEKDCIFMLYLDYCSL